MSEETKTIHQSFVEIQRELITKDYKTNKKSYGFDYLDWGKLCTTVMPIVNLYDCGLKISVNEVGIGESGTLHKEKEKNGKIIHNDVAYQMCKLRAHIELFNFAGESIFANYEVVCSLEDNIIQSLGGAYTYTKRYALQMFFALPIGEYDPDAFVDGGNDTKTTNATQNKQKKPTREESYNRLKNAVATGKITWESINANAHKNFGVDNVQELSDDDMAKVADGVESYLRGNQ